MQLKLQGYFALSGIWIDSKNPFSQSRFLLTFKKLTSESNYVNNLGQNILDRSQN